jgi:hypothetical protein
VPAEFDFADGVCYCYIGYTTKVRGYGGIDRLVWRPGKVVDYANFACVLFCKSPEGGRTEDATGYRGVRAGLPAEVDVVLNAC